MFSPVQVHIFHIKHFPGLWYDKYVFRNQKSKMVTFLKCSKNSCFHSKEVQAKLD